jgi:hypothetical protein
MSRYSCPECSKLWDSYRDGVFAVIALRNKAELARLSYDLDTAGALFPKLALREAECESVRASLYTHRLLHN